MDSKPTPPETWAHPYEVIPMFGYWDWRKYSAHGPYFLCLSGIPLEAKGQHGNYWRVCSAQEGPTCEIHQFASDLRKELNR